jgi:hypothetical protein
MREWSKSAFETALETAERMEGAPIDPRTVQWMRWAYLQAWLSPLGYRYEVRHEDAKIGPVSWDQLIRGRTENKIPEGAEARIVGDWGAVADLLAGRSLDLADYESSRSFFEESDGSEQLIQRMVSALMKLPRVDDALRQKIEGDARARGWTRRDVTIESLGYAIRGLLTNSVPGAKHVGSSFGDHQFHCMRRGALALALTFRHATDDMATLMVYAFRAGESYVIVSSTPI